jgi:hypothetical protein
LAAGFLAAGLLAAGFFAAGFLAADVAAGLFAGCFAAGAAAATVRSTILASAANFCTDATPLSAAALFSYAWLEATIWPLVETSEKRNFPVGPFLITNFPGTSASRSEGVCASGANRYRRTGGRCPEETRQGVPLSSYTGQAMDTTPAEFLIAIAIAVGISLLTFRHADKHGSTHATAWGIGAFLAAGVVVPVYFIRFWLRKRRTTV